MSRYFIVLCVWCSVVLGAEAQQVLRPNYAKASHPLVVAKVSRTVEGLVLDLELTNQTEGGYFCADRWVSIRNKQGLVKVDMLRSQGIPTCPDVYRFKAVGEVLRFKLVFPAVGADLVYVDLKEECADNCFEVLGIVLDPSLNTQIDLAHGYFEQGKLDMAVMAYRRIVREHSQDYPFAVSYFNLIHFLVKQGDLVEAKRWFKVLKGTGFVDTEMTLNRLRKKSYYRQLL